MVSIADVSTVLC